MCVHSSVASVSNPVGRSSSVAGSSFMQVRKTSAAPGADAGRGQRQRDRAQHVRRAPAQRPGDLLQGGRGLGGGAAPTAPTASGRNSVAYASASSQTVW